MRMDDIRSWLRGDLAQGDSRAVARWLVENADEDMALVIANMWREDKALRSLEGMPDALELWRQAASLQNVSFVAGDDGGVVAASDEHEHRGVTFLWDDGVLYITTDDPRYPVRVLTDPPVELAWEGDGDGLYEARLDDPPAGGVVVELVGVRLFWVEPA